ncbi:MAG TPA: hypothetical protein VLH10_27740 [Yinghuangia sp.]|nr:hypothetical protein [Yinghuangia sp.]
MPIPTPTPTKRPCRACRNGKVTGPGGVKRNCISCGATGRL